MLCPQELSYDPDTNAHDLGSAEYKIRHLFLSDISPKFVNSSNTEFSLGVNATETLEYNSETVSTSSMKLMILRVLSILQNVNIFISGGVIIH